MQKNKIILQLLKKAALANTNQFLLSIILLFSFCITACSAHANKPEINHFIDKMVKKHQFDRQYLQQLFNTVKPNRSIIKSFVKPKENLTWSDYKPIFVTKKRADEGVKFWQKHKKTLQYTQRYYGVSPAVIVAILGIETRYGQVKCKYRVLDSLSLLSFNHTRRTAFFQNELEQFLLLSRENKIINAETTKGSYAGAIGQGQFMPSSYRHLAVDSSHKGYSDLINNPDDAILSVANYLKHYGWLKNAPIAVSLKNKHHNIKQLPSTLKNLTLKDFEKYNIYPKKALPKNLKANLISLTLRQGKEYWLGFNNFNSIKRYNSSTLYAMAVYQLSELINQHYQQEPPLHVNK